PPPAIIDSPAGLRAADQRRTGGYCTGRATSWPATSASPLCRVGNGGKTAPRCFPGTHAPFHAQRTESGRCCRLLAFATDRETTDRQPWNSCGRDAVLPRGEKSATVPRGLPDPRIRPRSGWERWRREAGAPTLLFSRSRRSLGDRLWNSNKEFCREGISR